MLDLQLASQADGVREIVAEEKDEAMHVNLVFLATVVVDLAVAADLRLRPPAAGVRAVGQGRFDQFAGRLDLFVGLRDLFLGGLDPRPQFFDDRLLLLNDPAHFLGRRRRILRQPGRRRGDGHGDGDGEAADTSTDSVHGNLPFLRRPAGGSCRRRGANDSRSRFYSQG